MTDIYSKRVWLNKDDSPSTGSVVAYSGPVSYGGDIEQTSFLEIGGCHEKIRLHVSKLDSMKEFIDKMTLLRDTIDDFICYLKKKEEDN